MTAFPPDSRYAGVDTTTWTAPDGRVVVHLRRRAVPQPDALAETARRPVTGGDRLDLLAAELIGDPRAFWRLTDANLAILPRALLEPGRVLRVTLPAGVPGPDEGAGDG